MNRYIRKALVCLGWCVIVGALESVLLGLLAGMYIGVKQGMQTAGFDGEAFMDSVATPWITSTVMGTLTVLIGAGFSGLLWGARDNEKFVPTEKIPEELRKDLQTGVAAGAVNAVVTALFGLWYLLGNSNSAHLMLPSDMLTSSIAMAALALIFHRTKKLAPCVILFAMYLSGQVAIVLNGRMPDAGSITMAILFITCYAKAIRGAWRYRKMGRLDEAKGGHTMVIG